MPRPKASYAIEASNRTNKAFNEVRGNFDELNKGFVRLQGSLAGILGAAGLGAMIKQAVDAGDRIQKLSVRLGASTEALSELQHVADLSGVSFETLSRALQGQTRRVSEAAAGTGEAVKALRELNLSAEALTKLAPEKQFEILAEALSKVDNQADRVRLAVKFWESEGAALLQTVEGGAAGIRAMRQEAEDLGLTLSQTEADALAKTNDAFARMSSVARVATRTIAIELAPAISRLAETVGRSAPIIARALSFAFNLLETVGKGLGAGFAEITALVQGDIRLFLAIEREFQADLDKIWNGIEEGSGRAANALGEDLAAMSHSFTEMGMNADKALAPALTAVDKLLQATRTAAERLAEKQIKLREKVFLETGGAAEGFFEDQKRAALDEARELLQASISQKDVSDFLRKQLMDLQGQAAEAGETRIAREFGELARQNTIKTLNIVREISQELDNSATSAGEFDAEFSKAASAIQKAAGEVSKFLPEEVGTQIRAEMDSILARLHIMQDQAQLEADFDISRAVAEIANIQAELAAIPRTIVTRHVIVRVPSTAANVPTGTGAAVDVGPPPVDVVGSRATGGAIPRTGLYHLEAGERVINNNFHNTINITAGAGDDWRHIVRTQIIPELAAAGR